MQEIENAQSTEPDGSIAQGPVCRSVSKLPTVLHALGLNRLP